MWPEWVAGFTWPDEDVVVRGPGLLPGLLSRGRNMSAIVSLAAVVVDCRQAAPLAAFYQAAFGGEIVRSGGGSAWLSTAGLTVIFREVDGYQPPTWPSGDVPMQVHLDLWVDDLGQAEEQLHRLGAVTADPQPPGPGGLVVMRDPAGHLFCICERRPG
jgi:catechol 2,3-dioxygenase-like lactoylglutathione lyase family enzyme